MFIFTKGIKIPSSSSNCQINILMSVLNAQLTSPEYWKCLNLLGTSYSKTCKESFRPQFKWQFFVLNVYAPIGLTIGTTFLIISIYLSSNWSWFWLHIRFSISGQANSSGTLTTSNWVQSPDKDSFCGWSWGRHRRRWAQTIFQRVWFCDSGTADSQQRWSEEKIWWERESLLLSVPQRISRY